MTGKNFKIAFRILWKDKFNTVLNILGLSIGIASFFLMGNYVLKELSYDHFHTRKDKIYRVWLKEVYNEDKVFFNSVTPPRFERLLEEHFSEFDEVIQVNRNSYLVGEADERYNESVYIISPEFFDVFDFKILSGDPKNPLPDRNSITISSSYAIKYFGEDNPLGRLIEVQMGEEIREFKVSSVMADPPENSSISFDLAISNENNNVIFSQGAMEAWFSVSSETYVLVGDNSSIATVESGIQDVVMGYLEGRVERGQYNIGFQPLTDIHLNPGIPLGFAPVGNPDYVYILGFICVLIIAVACINYTTLAVGRSLKRYKEIGIRKIMGAHQRSLISQYLTESIAVTFLALIVGVILAVVLLPYFNQLTGANVTLAFSPTQVLMAFILMGVMGIAAGFYPAVILSGQKVTSILQGGSGRSGKNNFRRGMVVFQFLITVFLVSSTLIVKKQLNYMQSLDLGFDHNAVISVPLYPPPEARSLTDFVEGTMEKGQILKERLTQYPDIESIGMGSHVFGTPGWGNISYTDDNGAYWSYNILFVDPYYFETFGIEMTEGVAFDPESGLDKRQSIIINESAARYIGYDIAIGESLPGYNPGEHAIIGVAKDFNFESLHSEIRPLVISQSLGNIYSMVADHDYGDSPSPKLVFRYTGNQLSSIKDILDREWAAAYPGEELNFEFVEENMNFQYESEVRLNKLVTVAGILSMIIACLGLIGLAVLVTNSRTKEIGIRKIVGASVSSIFGMLVNSFAIQLVIGAIISIPFTYWLMNNWLENFAYQVNIGPVVFIVSCLISVAVALLVITFHTLRAARNNPVDALRIDG